MAKKDSKSNMYEHSEVKVKLLGTYLERYLNILNRSPFIDDIHYFDLFCAEGIYENGGEGSPVIVLKAIKEAYYSSKGSTGKSGRFHVTFNDIDQSKIEKLKQNIRTRKLHYPEIGKIEFKKEDYNKILPQIVDSINKTGKNEKAFVFIDPYGYKEIRISDIKNILENKKTEVLLFLPTHFMFRFHENGTPECLIEFINELVPEKEWPKTETGLEFIETLNDSFKKYLGSDYFVDSFAISRDKNQFFCLFFFTSHIYGYDRMIDAKWELDEEDGRGWKFNATFDLFSQIDKSPNVDKFEKRLIEFISLSKSNSEIYEFTLRSGHRPKHAVDVLKRLQNQDSLIVSSKTEAKPRKGAFYLDYKNYKMSKNKVFFQLKK